MGTKLITTKNLAQYLAGAVGPSLAAAHDTDTEREGFTPARLSSAAITAAAAAAVTPAAVAAALPARLSDASLSAAYARIGKTAALRPLPVDPRSLLAPGAPFARLLNAAGGTVTVDATNQVNPNRSIAASTLIGGSPYATLTAAGNFQSTTNGVSPCHVYPQTTPGRKPFRTLLGFDGLKIGFQVTSAPGHFYRIWVDDQCVTDPNGVAGPGNGGVTNLTLTFATAQPRRIRLDMTFGDLKTIFVAPTDSVWALQPRGPRCIVLGDSYVGGAGAPTTGYSGLSSWMWMCADILGWENVWNSGIGGTGYVTRNAAQTNNYVDRAQADVIAFTPDVVIIQGGRNDYPSGAAAIGTAAGNLAAALRTGLPNAALVFLGPNGSAAPVDGSRDTTWGPIQDAIFTAVAPYNVITVDYTSSGIFTGTGKAGTTTGSGNGDSYMQADGVHPTQAGSDYLGRRQAHKILAALASA